VGDSVTVHSKENSLFGPSGLAWGVLSKGFKLKPTVRDLCSIILNILLKGRDKFHSLPNASSKADIMGQYLISKGRCWSSVNHNMERMNNRQKHSNPVS
jgi:hypothetical protein